MAVPFKMLAAMRLSMEPGVHTMSDELILQISCNIFLDFKWMLSMRSGHNISHYTTAKPSGHVWNHDLIWWKNKIDTHKTFPQDYDYELLNLNKTKIPITIVKAQMPSNLNQKSRTRDNYYDSSDVASKFACLLTQNCVRKAFKPQCSYIWLCQGYLATRISNIHIPKQYNKFSYSFSKWFICYIPGYGIMWSHNCVGNTKYVLHINNGISGFKSMSGEMRFGILQCVTANWTGHEVNLPSWTPIRSVLYLWMCGIWKKSQACKVTWRFPQSIFNSIL